MHDRLIKSVPLGYGCFEVNFQSLLQATPKLFKLYGQVICVYLLHFQACDNAGYRDIKPVSELLEHPFYYGVFHYNRSSINFHRWSK